MDPAVPSWGHSRVSKKVPFLSGLFSHENAVRQQSQKITDRTAADAGAGYSKLCAGEVVVLKTVSWLANALKSVLAPLQQISSQNVL